MSALDSRMEMNPAELGGYIYIWCSERPRMEVKNDHAVFFKSSSASHMARPDVMGGFLGTFRAGENCHSCRRT